MAGQGPMRLVLASLLMFGTFTFWPAEPVVAQPAVLRLAPVSPVVGPGDPILIDVFVDNPPGQSIGGYQVAISYLAARYALDPLSPPTFLPGSVLTSSFGWNGPPPVGSGFPSCPLWDDGLERDVVSVLGSRDPAQGPFLGASGHLCRLTFINNAAPGDVDSFLINNFEIFCPTWLASFVVNGQGTFLVTNFSPTTITTSGVAPVQGLTCVHDAGTVLLSWTNGEVYSAVRLYRDGIFVGSFLGQQTQTSDGINPGEAHTYAIVGVAAGVEAPHVLCTITAPVPAVQSLSCQGNQGDVTLNWQIPLLYETLEVFRDGVLVAALPGSSSGYTDLGVGTLGSVTYEVVGRVLGVPSAPASCAVALGGAQFLRGDSNGDGSVNISDALPILNHVFGIQLLSCLDAGDIDDSGALQVNDPVLLLGYLFTQGAPPAPPFPGPGVDPTPDSLLCP